MDPIPSGGLALHFVGEHHSRRGTDTQKVYS